MIDRDEFADIRQRAAESSRARGGGSEGVLAWANGAGIDPTEWVRFLKQLVGEHVQMAPPPARAFLVHGLHHTDVAEGLSLTLDALAAQSFQAGWIAATLHADIPAVRS